MENNRRSFFKGLTTFVSGVVAAKASSYIPKKEEPKEEQMVTSGFTIMHEGVEYHPLVVKKTDEDKLERISRPSRIQPNGPLTFEYKATIRKANV
jgi:hypothetical protein